MSTLPPKPKKPPIVPIPLVLVVVFIVAFVIWGQLSSVSGKKLVILHTNDLQGQLDPIIETVNGKDVEIGGLARIAAKVHEIKEKQQGVILLDAGDTIQGTLFTKIYGGEHIGEIMSKIGYDAVTIGEHDFDKGPEGLKKFIKASTFPFLAANVDASKSEFLKDTIAPSLILNVNDIKVGIFGLITPDAKVFAKTGEDIDITNPKDAARKVIDDLKPKCDIIIALTHLGLADDRRLAAQVPDIDIIVGGGSKTKLSAPVIVNNTYGGKTIIVQAKNQGRYLGKLDIAVNNQDVKLLNYQLINIDSSITPDTKIESIVTTLYEKLKDQKPVGETTVDLDAIKSNLRTGETNLGDLFTIAVKEAFPEVDIVFQNAGGIRGDEIIPAGKLTVAEVWGWHPFENTIVLVTLNGREVKEVLERGASNLPQSKGNFLQVYGISYTVDLTGKPQEINEDNTKVVNKGERILDVKVNGEPLDFNKDYRVAINDFMAGGGDGFVTFTKFKHNDMIFTNISLTDVVVDYIKKHSPIDIKADGRIQVQGGLLR